MKRKAGGCDICKSEAVLLENLFTNEHICIDCAEEALAGISATLNVTLITSTNQEERKLAYHIVEDLKVKSRRS